MGYNLAKSMTKEPHIGHFIKEEQSHGLLNNSNAHAKTPTKY